MFPAGDVASPHTTAIRVNSDVFQIRTTDEEDLVICDF
jgi:hypothetical protein